MPKSVTKKYRSIWFAIAIAALALLLYSRVGTFGFLNYDDNDYVTGNAMVQQGLNLNTVSWAFTTGHASHWHPLTWLSHALDWALFGSSPRGHHFASVVLHALNGAVLFLALQRLTKEMLLSACVAVLFVIHPMNVQSVAWIAERKNVLSTFFAWTTLLLYARYLEQRSLARYIAVAVGIVLGLMSKAMLVTWPMVLLLIDWWPARRMTAPLTRPADTLRQARTPILEKLPLLVLVLLSSVVTYAAMKSYGSIGLEESYPLGVRLQNVVVSYVAYIGKLFVPFSLAPFYPHPMGSIPFLNVVVAALIFIAITFFAVKSSKSHPYLAFGWLWYVGTLVPVIGFVQAGEQAMGDRYAYVPYVGLFVAIVWGARDLARYLKLPSRTLGIAFSIVALLLAARTWNELGNWRDDVTLWKHAVAVTDNNYVAHQNLGVAYRARQRNTEAIRHFEEALRIRPAHANTLVNLGTLLLDAGNYDQAMALLRDAVKYAPKNASAQLNLGMGYVRGGKVKEGLIHLHAAVELTPHDYRLSNLLGSVYARQGRKDEARHWFEETLRINPGYDKALANLRLLDDSGN